MCDRHRKKLTYKGPEISSDKGFLVETPEHQEILDQGLGILARIIARDILQKRLAGIAKINEGDL